MDFPDLRYFPTYSQFLMSSKKGANAAAYLFFCPLNNDEETVDEETPGGVGMGAVGGRPRVVAARMC